MFGIGDFARHGRVSVRMLRHYDAIGLLRPAVVDPASSYRSYEAGQLARLNRIVALKDLGFTLREVTAILDEEVGAEQLRGMLTLRRAQLRRQIDEDAARLAAVEARLRLIESEGLMPEDDIQIKRIPAVRVAARSATAPGFEPASIGPVVETLYDELRGLLGRSGVSPVGPGVAWYEAAPADAVAVHAGLPVDAAPGIPGVAVVDLPAIDRAATIVHRGPMAGVMTTLQVLARWIEAHGYRSAGYNREVYLDYGCAEDSSGWTTELQEPVAAG